MSARLAGLIGLAAVTGALHLLPAASARTVAAAAGPPSSAGSEYDRALNLGIRAYVYGIPLLDTCLVIVSRRRRRSGSSWHNCFWMRPRRA